jgi:LysR family transcriptional regulator, glycine cleavage system transcriptional activator
MRRVLPPLNAVRAFEAAARHLSFARAADELCVTPSAVGQSVRALERWLGVPLFVRNRSQQQLSLTEAGRLYLPLICRSLDWIAAATRTVRNEMTCAQEVLAVSSRPAFALHWLIPNIVAFQLSHLEFDVRVSTLHGDDESALDEGVADLSVRYGRPDSWTSPLEAVALMPDALTPVASPALAACIRTSGDLAALSLIHSRSAPEDWSEWAMICGLPPLATAGRLVVADRSLAIEAALAGRGVALCDVGLVGRLVEAGALAVPLPHLRLVRGTAHCLVWRQERTREPKISCFRDWITAHCAARAA